MTEPIRILVFGSTGTGKTSVCNTLTGRNRPADGGAVGVTAKSHVYGKFEHAGQWIELVDTVGLHEADSGTVPADEAVIQLVELLKHAKEGFSLLIHVARAGRLTKQHQEDYDFFVNKMTQGRIPVILVLTGCENVDPMTAWADQNRDHFRQFQYRELLPSCFASGGNLESHFAPLRLESKNRVLAAILATALPVPFRLFGEGTGTSAAQLLAKLWNDVVEIAGLPAKFRAKTNEGAYEFLRRIGVSSQLADMAIAHLPDLAAEVASKLPIPGLGQGVRYLVKTLLNKALPKGGTPKV